ncbi:MAG: hypothetical protein WAX89_04540 [Alphaproteobacteria bacterium]
MTRICSNAFLLLLAATAASSAYAQTASPTTPTTQASTARSSAASSRMEWPKTFTGQPDFDFVRDDVLKERQRKKENGEDVGGELPTWRDLLQVKRIDTFMPKLIISSTEPLLGYDATAEDQPEEEPTPANELPKVEAVADLDLEEFKAQLQDALDTAIKKAKPHYEEVNVAAEVQRIQVSTISTSPLKYAMLNNKKYKEGEHLLLQVRTMPSLEEVTFAINQTMPDAASMNAESYAAYAKLRDNVLTDFTNKRQTSPDMFVTKHPLKVLVKRIASRSITYEVLGKEYDVNLKLY